MGNLIKGEVSFESGGNSYMLKLSTNAICELEAMTGKGVNEFAAGIGDIETFKVTDLRTMFHACLIGGGNKEIEADAVGDLMDGLSIEKVGDLVQRAFSAAFPDAAEVDEGEGKGKAAP